MGAFYNSICLPLAEARAVRAALTDWLRLRGFEPRDEPVRFDLDPDVERAAYLASNDRWTLLFYSRYEEEGRLIQALQEIPPALLYLWVYDSDAWGYELFEGGRRRASYSSDLRTHQAFAEDARERPGAAPTMLGRLLGHPDVGDAVDRILHARHPFPEDALLELCALFGIEGAVTGYDDLDYGTASRLEGWEVEQLYFVRSEVAEEERRIDLHAHDLEPSPGSVSAELSQEVLAEMERVRRRARLTMGVLRPLARLAGSRAGRADGSSADRGGPGRRFVRELSATAIPRLDRPIELRNSLHGCAITLSLGAQPARASLRPAAVFAFQVATTPINCIARRLRRIGEVLRRPAGSQLLRDESYTVDSGFPARHVVFELADRPRGAKSYVGLHVVQASGALYVFLYRNQVLLDETVERVVRQVAKSFRLL